jgi:hypothetical protein
MLKYLFGFIIIISYCFSSAVIASKPRKKIWTMVATYHDLSKPLREMALIPQPARLKINIHTLARMPGRFKLLPGQKDSAIQSRTGLPLPIIAGVSMQGMGVGFLDKDGNPYVVKVSPADPNLSVSNQHVVQIVNTDYAVFDKSTGALVFGPVAEQSIWAGFPGRCGGASPLGTNGDGVVKYDRIADRWVITVQSTDQPPDADPKTYAQCFAISQTSDPTGNYHRYQFDFPEPRGVDYGKLGVWPDAYYMSFFAVTPDSPDPDDFLFKTVGLSVFNDFACAFERDKMLVGDSSARAVCSETFDSSGFLPSDLDGPTLPPNGAPNYFVGFGPTNNTLGVWKFHVDWENTANSTFIGPILLNVRNFGQLSVDRDCKTNPTENFQNCIPQRGIADKLDIGDNRFMYRLAYRNFGSHASLVVNHTVDANGVAGIRWYEIRINRAGTPGVYQQGTYSHPDNNHRWYSSAAMDKMGNIALGYNVSGNNLFPAIRYAGRIFTDPLHTLRDEVSLIEGSGSQIKPAEGDNWNRWDDYTSTAIDPSDDCTFWYTAEYMKSTAPLNNWSTFIGSFKFRTCR